MRLRSRGADRGRLGLLALLGVGVLALALLPLAFSPSGSAAEPPPAQAGYAVVGLYVGGDRSSPTTIGPLGGVTFGFFTSRPPTSAYDDTLGIVTDVTPAQQCTSAADGWCNLRVPIGTGPGQVPTGTRYWVAPIGVPAGWYGNPYWQTAPLTPSGTAPRYQTQHIFQTPALTSGSRFLSTTADSGFMDDPGDTVTDTAFMNANGGSTGSGATSNNFMRRTASGGTWPLARGNPALPAQCGLNVALVVDLSSSVQTPTNNLPALKSAMDTFVNALQGTPSQVSITTFGTSSPAAGFPDSNTGLLPVASSGDAAHVRSLYSGWTTIPTNYTNWDAGLERVSALDDAQHIDLAVVITDGNPTVYGNTGGVPTNSGFTRFREMENSVASANEVKTHGTRVVAVGVGDGLDEGSARNLRSISGPTRYEAGGDISQADFLQQSDYGAAGDALRRLVVGGCAPSISVVKQIIPNGGTIADAYTPSAPWTFTASTTSPGAAVVPPATRQTDATGGTNFDVTVPETGSGTFNVAEEQQSGYTLHPVDGANAVCVDKTHDDADVPVTNGPAPDSFTVDVAFDGAISCTVYNEAPDPAASVVVHKRWQVTAAGQTETYDQYAQPLGLDAELQLSGPGTAGLSDQTWSDPRHGYVGGDPVTIAEHLTIDLPGCTLTAATIEGTNLSGSVDLEAGDPRSITIPAIDTGDNAWTITNAVTCRSQLTLAKEVHPASAADPDAWTLDALGDEAALTGPSGTTGVTADVTPDSVYQLAESHGDDPELLNFVQTDHRPRPIQWEQSTGSVDCFQTDGDNQFGEPQGNDGSVTVPLGHHVTCVFTNTAAPLTVIKHVEGGTAEPGDFTIRVEPVAPFPAGLPSREFAGEDSPGTHVLARPGQTYRLAEVDGPAGYQLSSLTCGVRQPRAAPDEFTMPADGAPVICTATNSYSEWTAEKSADPPSGEVQPGTVITYTLTARHLEGGPIASVFLSDDLTDVLKHATFVQGSIDASAGTASLQGSEVVWTIPELAGTETVSFQVRVDDDAWGVTLTNRLGSHFTGTPEDPGDPGIDCTEVTGDPDCDSTVHTTPPKPGGGPEPSPGPGGPGGPGASGAPGGGQLLPGTGGPHLWPVIAGGLALTLGGALLAAAGRRRRA